MSFLGIAIVVLDYVARWKLFEKAGEEGWKDLIPYYNLYIYCKLANCVNLFIVDLVIRISFHILGFIASIQVFLWAIRSSQNIEFVMESEHFTDIIRAIFGLEFSMFLMIIPFIMLAAIALTIIRIFINLKFVKCWTDETLFKALAGIGSVGALYILLVIARSVLAFDDKYQYKVPKIPQLEEK